MGRNVVELAEPYERRASKLANIGTRNQDIAFLSNKIAQPNYLELCATGGIVRDSHIEMGRLKDGITVVRIILARLVYYCSSPSRRDVLTLPASYILGRSGVISIPVGGQM